MTDASTKPLVWALAGLVCLTSAIPAEQDSLARARALLEAEEFAAALDALDEALSDEPESPEAHLLKGRAHESLAQWDEAIASYLEAGAGGTEARGEALRYLAPLWMRLGRDVEALEAYQELARLFPDDTDLAIPLGILQARRGLYRLSIETLHRALDREETSAEAHHYLGTVYSAMEDWPRALEHLDRALALRSDVRAEGLSLYEKAMVFSRQEKFSEALELLELADEKMPESGIIHFRAGEIHLYQGELERAEASLREALRVDPTLAAARTQLGVVLFQGRRIEEASRVLEDAVRRLPEDAETHHWLARAYAALDAPEVSKSRRHFETALALDPSLTEAYLNFGNFLRRHGERERGEELLERFRELTEADKELESLERLASFAPGNEEAKRELLRRLVDAGDVDTALGHAQRFVVEEPERLQNHINLAMVYLRMGNFDDARDTLERVVGSHADHPAVQGLLGDAYLGLERATDAVDAYQRAAELETASADWSTKLAMTHLSQGDRERASRAFEQAMEKAPEDARAYNGLGVIELDAGRIDRAVELLEKAIELAPDLAAAHRNLGEAYLKSGRAEDGERALARAEALERRESR